MITQQAIIDKYYQALLDRDAGFLGIFFAAVKTTRVFCIATCRARKPKKENVAFYSSCGEALEYGYRPCKVCRPTENAHEAPAAVVHALSMVRENLRDKVDDQRLRDTGISPEMVRRWFKDHYGMTFHAYQRMYRINNAYEELKRGKTATETAYDAGYESLSGFGYTCRKLTGRSPRQLGQYRVVLMSRLTTPLGPMIVCTTDEGVCLLEFTARKMLETEFGDLQQRLGARILAGDNAHSRQARAEIGQYFEGHRTTFDVPLHLVGTDFQVRVWRTLLQIPYGTTTSYLEQARSMGVQQSVRAVAAANGCNKVSLIVPCHRVIGSDGRLTGYGGGLERKRWLLDFERT